MVSKVTPAFMAEARYSQRFSDRGWLYDFRMVGIAAKPSAAMLKRIANVPSRVSDHSAMPARASTPQPTSNRVSLHSDCLFTKEAIKIASGDRPTINVMTD